ncbi:unnamed protein product [Rhizophagus irregularis]|nr:unnamed protein product [Rhizophagus irregularis]
MDEIKLSDDVIEQIKDFEYWELTEEQESLIDKLITEEELKEEYGLCGNYITAEFLKEVESHILAYCGSAWLIQCFGITKDPKTENFIMIMELKEDDDLNLDNLDSSLISDMARANPEPIQRITNNYLPTILYTGQIDMISTKFPVFVEMLWKCYTNLISFNHIHQGFHSGNHATLTSIIVDRLQKVLQHTERRLLLNQYNLDISYDDINHF